MRAVEFRGQILSEEASPFGSGALASPATGTGSAAVVDLGAQFAAAASGWAGLGEGCQGGRLLCLTILEPHRPETPL